MPKCLNSANFKTDAATYVKLPINNFFLAKHILQSIIMRNVYDIEETNEHD